MPQPERKSLVKGHPIRLKHASNRGDGKKPHAKKIKEQSSVQSSNAHSHKPSPVRKSLGSEASYLKVVLLLFTIILLAAFILAHNYIPAMKDISAIIDEFKELLIKVAVTAGFILYCLHLIWSEVVRYLKDGKK
jgi:hypothetical protein